MVNLYKQDGETLYGIKEFLLDSVEDLTQLPKNIRCGSSALIIPTGELYILDGKKEWTLFGGQGSNSDGETENGSSECKCEDILNQLDSNDDGIVDYAEQAGSFTMYDM